MSASLAQAATSTAHEHRAAAFAGLLRASSLEASVKDLTEVDAYREVLPARTEVYISWLPAFPYHHVVAVAARLAAAGLTPVPHIAARRLTDRASAEDLMARLEAEAGVERVLLIAGDVDLPAGPYDSAAAFLRTGLLERHGIRSVGLAGYPEGHPRIAAAGLEGALREKLRLAGEAGLEAHVVTQFCFDADTILGWLGRLARSGVDVPVRVGLAGPASVRTLIAYGIRCGVGPSLRAIKSQGISLTRLMAQSGPEPVIGRLAEARASGELGASVRLHFFTFGGVVKTARWRSQAAGSAPRQL